jgi:hypothetical protein
MEIPVSPDMYVTSRLQDLADADTMQIAIAQHLGLQIMRMASTPILPFNTTHYAIQLEGYLNT